MAKEIQRVELLSLSTDECQILYIFADTLIRSSLILVRLCVLCTNCFWGMQRLETPGKNYSLSVKNQGSAGTHWFLESTVHLLSVERSKTIVLGVNDFQFKAEPPGTKYKIALLRKSYFCQKMMLGDVLIFVSVTLSQEKLDWHQKDRKDLAMTAKLVDLQNRLCRNKGRISFVG